MKDDRKRVYRLTLAEYKKQSSWAFAIGVLLFAGLGTYFFMLTQDVKLLGTWALYGIASLGLTFWIYKRSFLFFK